MIKNIRVSYDKKAVLDTDFDVSYVDNKYNFAGFVMKPVQLDLFEFEQRSRVVSIIKKYGLYIPIKVKKNEKI